MEAAVLEKARCPVCGHVGASKCVATAKVVVDEETGETVISSLPFNDSSPLVLGHAKCGQCGSEFSPETGVIISQPEPIITDPGFSSE